MLDKIAKEESNTILPTIESNFKKYGVEVKTLSKIKKIDLFGVTVDRLDNEGNVVGEEFIACDFVVNALASVKNSFELEPSDKVIYIGDCEGERPSTIEHAIKTAYDAANSIN